jgi:hypothetical protein
MIYMLQLYCRDGCTSVLQFEKFREGHRSGTFCVCGFTQKNICMSVHIDLLFGIAICVASFCCRACILCLELDEDGSVLLCLNHLHGNSRLMLP